MDVPFFLVRRRHIIVVNMKQITLAALAAIAFSTSSCSDKATPSFVTKDKTYTFEWSPVNGARKKTGTIEGLGGAGWVKVRWKDGGNSGWINLANVEGITE
jgi:hypothetical protein